MVLSGIKASNGIAMADAVLLNKNEIEIIKSDIDDCKNEIQKFKISVKKSIFQLNKMLIDSERSDDRVKTEILKAHIELINDPELMNSVVNGISSEKCNAEYVLSNIISSYVSLFRSIDNEYMKEREIDIKDVGNRIIYNLLERHISSLSDLKDKSIIVAHDIKPSDIAQINKEKVLGFIIEDGGKNSHSAIMARNMGIPTVIGVDNAMESIKSGNFLIIDGSSGLVIVNPTEQEKQEYWKKKKEEEIKIDLIKLKNNPTYTKDGKRIKVVANIGSQKDIDSIIENGSEGIGLYRTEFIYMNRETLPSEEEQYEYYKSVLEPMNNKPVVIRTLDIGGDKKVPYLNLPKEINPFLGYRAIRICLDKTNIFKTQLRALLRASVYGNLKIMYPMISSLEELRLANKILGQVKDDLEKENIKYINDIEVGIMIEVPVAAIISDLLAKEVDFFSIGTNDLIQYSVAVDRLNQDIEHLYTPYHPALIRLIKMTIENGHRAGIWVGMCGEVAEDPSVIPLLVALDLDEFSMRAKSIPHAKKLISTLTKEKTEEILEKVLEMKTATEVEKYLKRGF